MSRLTFYKDAGYSFACSNYCNQIQNRIHRSHYAKPRLGTLGLEVERGHTDKERHLRFCKFCNDGSVEDEIHFLFDCNEYDEESLLFTYSILNYNSLFDKMNNNDKLMFLIKSEDHLLHEFAKYITNCFKKRNCI